MSLKKVKIVVSMIFLAARNPNWFGEIASTMKSLILLKTMRSNTLDTTHNREIGR